MGCSSLYQTDLADSATPASPVTIQHRPPQTPTSSDSAADAEREPAVAADGATQPRLVYFFGNGKAEGAREMRSVLGGKGANLAEMTNLGVPVPPGFTIACSVCIDFLRDGTFAPSLRDEVTQAMARLEEATGRGLGGTTNPLLVSVRSGAPVSMPGMMETILNLGLNDRAATALAEQSQNARFAYDSYRR